MTATQDAAMRRETAEEKRRGEIAMTALGIAWLAVWACEPLAADSPRTLLALDVAQNAIWAIFVVEFCARLVKADSRGVFLKEQWWELAILALPALRFVRVLRVLRVAKASRVFASAARATTSAQQVMSRRLTILTLMTVVVVVSGGRLLVDAGHEPYSSAMHDALRSALGGQPLVARSGFADFLEIVLLGHHAIVIGLLAGAMGAHFLGKKDDLQNLLQKDR